MKLVAFLTLVLATAISNAINLSQEGNTVSIENKFLKVTYNLANGTYQGVDLTTGTTAFSDARIAIDESNWKQRQGFTRTWETLEIHDRLGPGKTLSILETPKAGYRPTKILHLTLHTNQPYLTLGFSIINPHAFPIRVSKINILNNANFFPGEKFTHQQSLRGGAGSEPNVVENTFEITAFNSLMATGKIDGRRHSIVAGGMRYEEFLRTVSLSKAGSKLTITVEDPYGKNIPAGATFHSHDTTYVDFVSPDPFISLERYGTSMRYANKVNLNQYDFPTLCGWMVSTGKYGEGKPINNSKGLVEQMAIAKKSGILDYTPVAIRLEPDYYCYSNHGDTQQGWWDDHHWAKYHALTPPYETFDKFCKKISSLGGIPFTYFQSNMPSKDFAMTHPDWMLNNDISRLHAEHPHHMPFVKFDYTDPGFQEYTLATWKRLAREGMKGIKFDYPESAWCPNGGFEDKSFTATSAYREVFNLARKGLGKGAYLHERNLGEYGTPRLDITAGLADLQRVWGDSSHFEPEMASRIGLRWFKNRTVFGYYPDGKSFKNPKTKKPHTALHRRTLLTLVGLISGRIELGTSFGSMTPEMQHDLTRFYPIYDQRKSFRPVDMLLPGRTDPNIYSLSISGEWNQLIACNFTDKPTTISVPLSGNQADTGALGLQPNKHYYLYDFWNDRFIGKIPGKQSAKLPVQANQALSYSVHQVNDHPQFISTNRHIMQGLIDLKNVKWNAKTGIYSGIAKVIGGEDFTITIANNNYATTAITVSTGNFSIATGQHDLTRFTLSSEKNAEVNWAIKFEK